MMLLVSFLFLSGLYLSSKRNLRLLFIFIPLYTFVLLNFSVTSYFINIDYNYGINLPLFIIICAYNLIFFIFAMLIYNRGILSAFIFSALFTSMSYYFLSPPFNPLILLYSMFSMPFIGVSSALYVTFILFLIPVLLFCRVKPRSKFQIMLLLIVILLFLHYCCRMSSTPSQDMRIAAIQTGLYFEMGGNTESFPLDLVKFLEINRNIDLVVFSENSLYGNKTEYNRIQTEKLMSILNENEMFDKHAFIFNLYGYKDINNIVSVFKFKNIEIINQKEALIPYIEKKSFFSYENLFNSEYFYVSPNMKKQTISYKGHKISTFICFDSLFPSLFSNNDLVIVQSNYNRLNKGTGYEQILRNGGVLGWFSHAMNSSLYINVQDGGGSIIIRNSNDIDDGIFSHSLKTPFIIING